MALSDRLRNELQATIPGAAVAMIDQMIWNAINEACREGWIWRETVPITLVVGQADYTVAPTGTEVLQLLRVAHQTMDLTAHPAIFEFGTLTLTTTPTVADTASPLLAVSVLTPAITAGADVESLIPKDMWSKHHALFYAGVMGKMLAQPAKPYSNPQLAAFHTRDFRGRLAQAKREVETGGVPNAQTWRFNNWAPKALR